MLRRAIDFIKGTWLAWLVLFGGCGFSIYMFYEWRGLEMLQARQKHSQYIRLEKEKIKIRINSFIENLYAIRAASESRQIHTQQKSWDHFISKLDLFNRYSAVLSVAVYRHDTNNHLMQLYRQSSYKNHKVPSQILLSPELQKRRQRANYNNQPFAFFEDVNEDNDRSGPVLNIFIASHEQAQTGYDFAFQVHLPILMEELFGNQIAITPLNSDTGYTEVMSIDIAGANYNIYFVVGKKYTENRQRLSSLFLASAMILNFMLFIMIIFLSRSRERALNLANKMTREFRIAKQEADQANNAKSEFLARMSHEIRTPLNAIIGVGDLLKESPLDEDQKKYTDLFMTSSDMLLGVINDVLDISKIESGHLEIEIIEFNIVKLVKNSAALFQGKAQKKQIALHCHIDDTVHEMFWGDPTRIRQILTNLISNAIKFSNQNDRIDIYLKQKASPDQEDTFILTFQVRDQGIGIPADRLDAIFESFSQVDSSTTRKHGGTGLGLAICKKLCHLMQGDIKAINNEDKGSNFIFYLPLKAALSNTDETVEKGDVISDEHTSGQQQKFKILLAEDTEENAILIKAFLKKTPYELVHVANGQLALEAFQKDHHFDLVLMDIEMPIMDGLLATRAIRTWETENNLPPIHITALTAHALNHFQKKGTEAGCSSYLSKPIRKQVLIDFLARYFDTHTKN